MTTIAVVGLGYVGLPLAVEFGKRYPTIGLDLALPDLSAREHQLGLPGALTPAQIRAATQLRFSTQPEVLAEADVIIVSVPTPVSEAHQPDFAPLVRSSESIGRHMRPGATVVYESTVYPGATEQICIPVLERASGLVWKKDFFVGYSPERVNPGDPEHTLTKIVKVVAGDTLETRARLAELYASIIAAGVHPVSSIRVAEAAKVIENTQRDLNIALMNELSMLFHRVGIDTLEVLEAAGTKWNFMPFRPGLVGGHCIGVDPYYLTHKAQEVGYSPHVILAGRRINDSMAAYVAQQTVKRLIGSGRAVAGAQVIVLGLTFKENVADVRNSKVAEMVRELREFGCRVSVHDPHADRAAAFEEYGFELSDWDALPRGADALILAVAHQSYVKLPAHELLEPLADGGLFVDVKSVVPLAVVESLKYEVWRL